MMAKVTTPGDSPFEIDVCSLNQSLGRRKKIASRTPPKASSSTSIAYHDNSKRTTIAAAMQTEMNLRRAKFL